IASEDIFLLTMGDLEDLKISMKKLSPEFIIIDSIQTLNSRKTGGFNGSVSKLRHVTSELVEIAKSNNIAIFIIGHITKDGQIAGPKTLEHMVDVVLYFQGELQSNLKVLRVEKNRYGSVNELGIFQMSATGLTSVNDPSEVFLQKRDSIEPGTSVVASMKGMRSILIEIQALVTENPFGGNPRRMAIGFDPFRLSMLISIIEKKLRIPFYKSDVFLNITGGINLKETASDLAVCSALISSHKNLVFRGNMVFLGEVGLTGEIRPVSFIENRIKEAVNHGFKQFIIPKAQSDINIKSAEILPVSNIKEFYSIMRDFTNKK
ncbi:MAG: DNA repair protein RadA, partial [Candidatus Aminicenantes bacterium]|nr:DNA repair protein RadA [Candidatus Aminicenantes bacterium]